MTAAYEVCKVKSKPFSSSFEKQVAALQEYLPRDYHESICVNTLDLYSYYESEHIHRALRQHRTINGCAFLRERKAFSGLHRLLFSVILHKFRLKGDSLPALNL